MTLEIGATLRQARVGAGLDLAEVATATMIPARFLEALEQERFEQLPPGLYTRSFLREYAEFLGLDGDVYSAEYEARFAPQEPELPAPPSRSGPRWLPAAPRSRRALAALLLVVAGIAAWQLGSSGRRSTVTLPPAPTPAQTSAARTPRPRVAVVPESSPAGPPSLTLTAARGNCWLWVKTGSSAGRTIYERTLRQGETARFVLRRTLWIRVGAPWNLGATIGRLTVTAKLPPGPDNIVVTAAGIRPAT